MLTNTVVARSRHLIKCVLLFHKKVEGTLRASNGKENVLCCQGNLHLKEECLGRVCEQLDVPVL